MTKSRNRRVLVGVAVSAVALLAGIGGYAYWNLSGSGTATTVVGTTSDGLVTLYASIPNGIYPGGTRTVTYTADNTNSTDVRIATITVTGITADAGHSGCDTSDFSVTAAAQNVTVPAGQTGVALPTTATLSYANTSVSQDACKGATLTLDLSSS